MKVVRSVCFLLVAGLCASVLAAAASQQRRLQPEPIGPGAAWEGPASEYGYRVQRLSASGRVLLENEVADKTPAEQPADTAPEGLPVKTEHGTARYFAFTAESVLADLVEGRDGAIYLLVHRPGDALALDRYDPARSTLLAASVQATAALPRPSAKQSGGPATADAPLARVEALIREGRHAQARDSAREAQLLYRRRGDRHGEAIGLLLLGLAEAGAGNLTAAGADLERSAEALASLGDGFGSWAALWAQGGVVRRQGRPEEAIALHRRSLALLRQIEAARAPFSLRTLDRVLALPQRLLQMHPCRPEVCKPLLLQATEVRSRIDHVKALLDAGRLEEAEAELSRAARLSRRLEGQFDTNVALLRGDLLRRQQRLDEAREIYLAALHRTRHTSDVPPGDEDLELEALGRLMDLARLNSRFDEALVWNDQALALARSHDEPGQRAMILLVRGMLLLSGERFAAAEAALDEALALARKAGDVHQQAWIQSKLGNLALRAGQPLKAASRLEAAVSLFQSVDDPVAESQAWLLLVDVYSRFESLAVASQSLEKARELARRSRAPLAEKVVQVFTALERLSAGQGDLAEVERAWTALVETPSMRDAKSAPDRQSWEGAVSDLLHLADSAAPPPGPLTGPAAKNPDLSAAHQMLRGMVHARRGEISAAKELWLAALGESPPQEEKFGLLMLLGLAEKHEGRAEQAIRYLARAVDAAEAADADVRVEELLATSLGRDSRYTVFHTLIDLLARQGRPTEAFDYAERARARALLQGLGNGPLDPGHGADAQLVHEAEAQRSRLRELEQQAAAAAPEERQRLSSELERERERYEFLRVRLKVSNPGYSALARVEPLAARDVQAELPPDTTLVSYFVSPEQVHAWVLDREALHHVRLFLRAEDLGPAVCWAEEVSREQARRGANSPAGDGRGARRLDPRCGSGSASPEDLYRRLIAPLAVRIRHPKLILVPHGNLHYLPFAALRHPETGRYLIEDFTLTYAPSASAPRFLRSKETPVTGRALVLGDPSLATPDRPRLPAAGREAAAVARLLGTEPVVGPRAAESLLHGLGGQVDLLHVAAHGIYEPASPLFSRIALAPGGGHDGNLEVHEILAGLDLSGVNLVVLSACRTAAGERSGGDDVVGLTRAFLYAGSPGVISTLWDIDDNASAVLMEDLYRRLLTGASAAEALRQAQIALLRDPSYGDPYFWAAFSLAGDPQGRWQASR